MCKLQVLVCDDEEGLREGLKTIVRIEGHEVDTVATGTQAVELLKKNTYDIAFIDLKLGDISGIEILKRVGEIKTKIYVITAFSSVETAVEAMKHGANDYLCKPFNNNEIQEILDQASAAQKHQSTPDKHQKINQSPHTEMSDIRDGGVVTANAQVKRLLEIIDKVADANMPVMILGESGTGKEMFTREIHSRSNRNEEPYFAINCAAIPGDLLESELFGHEKGAFSGADKRKVGKFELAGKGILYLDEIGDMSFALQSKLLRVIEERSFERLGGIKQIPFEARIVSSTNKDLREMVGQKNFRADLYYRLSGIEMVLPPLRDRTEDVPLLVDFFLDYFCSYYCRDRANFTKEAISKMQNYPWHGNIRELKHVIESVLLLHPEKKEFTYEDLLLRPIRVDGQRQNPSASSTTISVGEIEKNTILEALKDHSFNKSYTAKALNISRKTLYNKLRKYDIDS